VGTLELHCQTLLDPDQSHRLRVYTAEPGNESYEKLQLLSVIGAHTCAAIRAETPRPWAGAIPAGAGGRRL